MTITTCLDTQQFTAKPQQSEAACISNRIALASQELSFDNFVLAIANGQTFTLATGFKDNKRSKINCQGLQIFAADVDANSLSYEQVLQLCSTFEAKPAMIYESFSSTPIARKWRVLWLAKGPITDFSEVLGKLRSIKRHFNSDSAIIDLSRMLYGTTGDKIRFAEEVYEAEKIVTCNDVANGRPKVVTKVSNQEAAKDTIAALTDCEKVELKSLILDQQIYLASNNSSRYQRLKLLGIALARLEFVSEELAMNVAEELITSSAQLAETFIDNYDKDYLDIVYRNYDWMVAQSAALGKDYLVTKKSNVCQ